MARTRSAQHNEATDTSAAGESRTTRPRRRSSEGTAQAATPSGGYDLVIVESPAKAKTLARYLGPGYRVVASYGHVRDLDTRKRKGEEVAGIRIADGWKLRYVVDVKGEDEETRRGRRRSAREILEEIRKAASGARRIYLASDPDREGESIAWHIADELQLPPERTYRIRFNEISKTAVQQALAHPDRINGNLVAAQEARRALDRVVGFPLSNLLGKKVASRLSAGRVQSVAVRLIVEREREIEAFRSEEYWKIQALLAPAGTSVAWKSDPQRCKVYARKKADNDPTADSPDTPVDTELEDKGDNGNNGATSGLTGLPAPPAGAFFAELIRWQEQDVRIPNEATADQILTALRHSPFQVVKVEQKDRQDRPPPPFITSTLQQQANIRLGFSTSRTMQTAQRLYEGVELTGLGPTALITYMRTDSTRVSQDALQAVRQFIAQDPHLGPSYLPDTPNYYSSGKTAQEAHEAIRPIDVTLTPQKARQLGLTGDLYHLYDLIWRRFVASQCKPAVLAITTVDIRAGQALFRASGRIIRFDGHRRVLPPVSRQEDTLLPPLQEQQSLQRLDLFATQHFTQPPPRYTEASLVKALEKEGIGRPSTYATIISTIQKRGYVTQQRGRFYATDIGKLVTDKLVHHFPRIMDVKFTSHFEEELDEIETGKCQYRQVLDEFWGPFSEELKKADAEMEPARMLTDEPCPKCGRPLEKRYSPKTGSYFLGCSGWKDKDNPCQYKRGSNGQEQEGPATTDIPCPACGQPMVRKSGRFGVFFTCSAAPNCPTTMNLGPDGQPVVTTRPTTVTCPQCHNHQLLLKASKTGKKYVECPDKACKFRADADDQGRPIQPPDTGIRCDKCGSPMVIRTAWRGPFLACSGFPKCRNAKSLTAELREKLKDLLPPPRPRTAASVPDVAVTQTCPECGAAMKLMKSRFGPGYYLGCSQYPKCKGKAKVSPELEAQIAAALNKATTAQAPAPASDTFTS
ncbi:MAG: type I DNA topoisomerase [Gemmataceae bacterium]|nr:type I DNA topoisomerase [Gemmataceae bacterium]